MYVCWFVHWNIDCIFYLKVKWRPHKIAFPEISVSSLEVASPSRASNKGDYTIHATSYGSVLLEHTYIYD